MIVMLFEPSNGAEATQIIGDGARLGAARRASPPRFNPSAAAGSIWTSLAPGARLHCDI
jgi:hypothetical protein